MTPETRFGPPSRDPFGSDSERSSRSAVQRTTDEQTVDQVFEALDDPHCRAIISATSEETLTATEVSERCDLPGSTAYRKLELLTEAGFLDEMTRMSHSGRHPKEYACRVTDVVITLGRSGEIELKISYREGQAETDSIVLLSGE